MTTVREAAQALAARDDDHAQEQNGVGFNGTDQWVHDALMFPAWDRKTETRVRDALHKYGQQLLGYGINIEEGLVFESTPMELVPMTGHIEVQGQQFLIHFKFNDNVREALKASIPGRAWDGVDKVWRAPASSFEAIELFAVAQGFQFTPEAQQLVDRMHDEAAKQVTLTHAAQVQVNVAAKPAPVQVPPRNIVFAHDVFEVRFPFDQAVLDGIRTITGRRFNTDNYDDRFWTVPLAAVGEVLAFARDFDFTLGKSAKEAVGQHFGAEALQEGRIEASKATTADIEVPGLGVELRPFQKAGVSYMVKNKRVLLGDAMGLGKTIQALAALKATEAFPALVVCPASLKLNWQKEARRCLPGIRTQVLTGRSDRLSLQADLYIVNYEVLSGYTQGLLARGLKALVCDESHAIKNPKAKRTQVVQAIAKDIPYRFLLTGTPVLNRPIELVPQLEVLGCLNQVAGGEAKYAFWNFAKTFCGAVNNGYGWTFQGATNTKLLNERLRRHCFVRREKMEVLTELPPKTKAILPVELTNEKTYKAKETYTFGLVDNLDMSKKGARTAAMTEFEALKHEAALGKMEAVFDWVDDFLENGEKLVLFAKSHDVQELLVKRYPTAARILGTDPMPVREANKERFQNDPQCLLLIGAMGPHAGASPAGVGWTLTAASNVAFIEFGWTSTHMEQCEDRTHRMGQHDSVTAYYFVAPGTIDEDVVAILDEKAKIVAGITDGIDLEDSAMLSELVKRTKAKSLKAVL